MITVVPITHVPPAEPSRALELPQPVKRHLGLDAERSWVILDEGNEFVWPGYDLRPVPGRKDRYDYGFLPPALFRRIVALITEIQAAGHGKAVPRD